MSTNTKYYSKQSIEATPDEFMLDLIEEASKNIANIVTHTDLDYSDRLSNLYNARIYLKREDLQPTRSYKIRGAYNLISSLNQAQRDLGIVTASAGNHAQGVALSAKKLKIKATIFMPITTQQQKINRVKYLGGEYISIKLVGNNFDECHELAIANCKQTSSIFIPPFDDDLIIAGQGTIAKEIYEDMNGIVDIVICPVGGGGLIAGVSSYFDQKGTNTEIIGVEPEGAAAMEQSIKNNKIITLETIDTFVDGAAVKKVGIKTFNIVKHLVKSILVIPVGKICSTMIELYQEDGIITEPAGALSVSCLDSIADSIKNKTVVCIISGGNNDLMRYPEIIKRSLAYEKTKS